MATSTDYLKIADDYIGNAESALRRAAAACKAAGRADLAEQIAALRKAMDLIRPTRTEVSDVRG
jgi:hypothetical protein